jgi:hypothetical protein
MKLFTILGDGLSNIRGVLVIMKVVGCRFDDRHVCWWQRHHVAEEAHHALKDLSSIMIEK